MRRRRRRSLVPGRLHRRLRARGARHSRRLASFPQLQEAHDTHHPATSFKSLQPTGRLQQSPGNQSKKEAQLPTRQQPSDRGRVKKPRGPWASPNIPTLLASQKNVISIESLVSWWWEASFLFWWWPAGRQQLPAALICFVTYNLDPCVDTTALDDEFKLDKRLPNSSTTKWWWWWSTSMLVGVPSSPLSRNDKISSSPAILGRWCSTYVSRILHNIRTHTSRHQNALEDCCGYTGLPLSKAACKADLMCFLLLLHVI